MTITNTSTEISIGSCGSITGVTVGITGDIAGVFNIDSQNCGSLSRGASCTANVIFTPIAEGGYTATFNANATGPFALSDTSGLTGTGLNGAGVTDNSAALLALSLLKKDDSSGCDATASTGVAGRKSFGTAAFGLVAMMGLVLGTAAIRRRARKNQQNK